MLLQFLVILATSSFALTYNKACFDAKELTSKLQPIHIKCKEEVKTQNNKNTCSSNYRICNFREMGVINDARDGIDHTKMINLLKQHALIDMKDTIANTLSPCSNIKYGIGDKIDQYFDCIQLYCLEIATVRSEFHASGLQACSSIQ